MEKTVSLTQSQLKLLMGMCTLTLMDATRSLMGPSSKEEKEAASQVGPKVIELMDKFDPLIEKTPSVGLN
jgi:hypothetical protein